MTTHRCDPCTATGRTASSDRPAIACCRLLASSPVSFRSPDYAASSKKFVVPAESAKNASARDADLQPASSYSTPVKASAVPLPESIAASQAAVYNSGSEASKRNLEKGLEHQHEASPGKRRLISQTDLYAATAGGEPRLLSASAGERELGNTRTVEAISAVPDARSGAWSQGLLPVNSGSGGATDAINEL